MTAQEKWRDLVKVKALYWEATGNDEIQPREATEEITWSRVEMRGWFRHMSRQNRIRGPGQKERHDVVTSLALCEIPFRISLD